MTYKRLNKRSKSFTMFGLALLLFGSAMSTNVYAYTKKENLIKCAKDNPYHVLVNQEHMLKPDYKPDNLIIPNVKFASSGNIEKNHMEATTGKALERMFNDAKKEGVQLVAVSGYRSYNRQKTLYNNAINTYGKNQKGSAKQGTSEHQTGLAMDVNSLYESFANTKEGKWLAKNSHKYGFIIRYPKGKTNITGYIYEPWHVRYVGEDLAKYCYENDLTLEEIKECCVNEKDVVLKLNETGKEIQVKVVEKYGFSYVKARDLSNLLNGTIGYKSGVLTFKAGHRTIQFNEDSNAIMIDGVKDILRQKPLTISSTNYLPLREVLGILGYNLDLQNNMLVVTNNISNVVLKDGEKIIRYEGGHAVIKNEYGDEFINGCSEGCIYGYVPIVEE